MRNAGGRDPVTVNGYNTMSGQQVAGQVEDQRTALWVFSVLMKQDRTAARGLVAKASMAPNLQSNIYVHRKQEWTAKLVSHIEVLWL